MYLDCVSKSVEGSRSAVVITIQKTLKLFAVDRDAYAMCRIAELMSHVEMFVVHEVKNTKGFPEVGDDDSDDKEFLPSDLKVDSADDAYFIGSKEEYDDKSGFEELTDIKDGSQVDKGKGVVNGDFSDEVGFNSSELDLEYEVGGGSDNEDRQEEDDYERRRYPIHKDVKDVKSYKWEVGTVFALREEFKGTITAYAVQTRRRIRYAKLDLVRVKVVCQQDCPFWLYTTKMGEETTWQLRYMNLKYTCDQAHRIGIMHILWLSKAFKKKVEYNPKVKIKELVNKAQRKWNLT
ncbi:hypothetical protein Ahy_A10g049000 [Arachis hypogaea]|uniref:Uncharacterized protein n=1 Tax=Arachis hypogaea TaxID=3818 RepID=A0A445B6C8_ARAHY|nr:hypothetical protein Ahy_A10g049000 [Arachis hypogaea]